MVERKIKVIGNGKLTIRPDTIRITIEIKGESKSYSGILKQSSEDVEILRNLIEKLGYDRKELKTLNFNVDTEYEDYEVSDFDVDTEDEYPRIQPLNGEIRRSLTRRRRWEKEFKGYSYKHNMKLEMPIDNDRLGKVLYELAHCSLAPEFSFEYGVVNTEQLKNELLAEAVKDSLAKATVLATAAGVKLGNIISINYSWEDKNFCVRPYRGRVLAEEDMDCDIMGESYDLDIEPDDIHVTDDVTIIWEIE